MGIKNSLRSLKTIREDSPVVTPPPLVVQPPGKKRILCWSDGVVATTGFGIVSKHILRALYDTGKYDISQLAINYFGDFYDKNEYPYQLVPARLRDPRDPYGKEMLLSSLEKGSFDYLFIINDSYVTFQVVEKILELREKLVREGKPRFKIVYYYPVDCRLWPDTAKMIKAADHAVAYNYFGKMRTEVDIGMSPHSVIYHGVDNNHFFPIEPSGLQGFRENVMKVPDPETFVWINVNRNSPRKDMAKTILAFSEFKKIVPNTRLYMHTKVVDGPGAMMLDLSIPCRDLGLQSINDVIFPQDFHPAEGVAVQTLNMLFNACDGCITTTTGEGWGLSCTDCQATGTPVLVPNNTSFPEIIGMDEERGYMYPCKERVYIDGQGLRPVGQLQDIVDTMVRLYEDCKSGKVNDRINNGLAFAYQNSWENIGRQWVALFEELDNKQEVVNPMVPRGVEEI